MNKQPDFESFLQWFKQNGGVHKKIQFPAKIAPLNYTGISAADDINMYQVFLAVPKTIIISISKIKQSKLGSIFYKYQFLNDQNNDQTDFNRLVLFLIWNKMMGQASFYYPYLEVLEKAQPIFRWSDEDIQKLNDPYISIQFVNYLRQDIPILFNKFNELSNNHPQLFKQPISQQDFQDCYASVMTRSFGWGLPETMMVPFADFLNHSSNGAQHYVLNKKLQQEKGTYQFQEQYVKKHFELQLSLLGYQDNIKIEHVTNDRQKLEKQFLQLMERGQKLNSNQQKRSFKQIQNQLLESEFDFQLCPSSNSQDNDSQQDDLSNQKTSDKFHIRQLNRLVKGDMQGCFQQPKRSVDGQFDSNITFKWWSKLNEKESYFILSAQRDIHKGQEIFNSYGRRSNRFLLIWYGFAHLNNKYDSIAFRIWDEQIQKKTGRVIFTRYLTEKDWYQKLRLGNQRYSYNSVSDQYRLKKDHLCYQLMAYIRFKISKKKSKSSQQINKVNFHQIEDLQMELKVLNQYLSILSQLIAVYQPDKQHTKLSTKQKDYFALVFKQSKRFIFEVHKTGITMVKNIVAQILRGRQLLQIYRSQLITGQKDSGQQCGYSNRNRRFINHYLKMLKRSAQHKQFIK